MRAGVMTVSSRHLPSQVMTQLMTQLMTQHLLKVRNQVEHVVLTETVLPLELQSTEFLRHLMDFQ